MKYNQMMVLTHFYNTEVDSDNSTVSSAVEKLEENIITEQIKCNPSIIIDSFYDLPSKKE